jgi:sugar phosphate isomerase/epimerase
MPRLRQIANLWTLIDHPSKALEWTLDEKLDAICEAGFDGVCWAPSSELYEGAKRRGLIFVGGMASGDPSAFSSILRELKEYGAYHVNVQLATDDVLTPEALKLTTDLLALAEPLGLSPAIESHRGTCTETPEKLYALADAYQHESGKLLPISWDFSHHAAVKHLVPENFAERLLIRPDLIQHAQQFHFRPFNGHHVQVPVTDGTGTLTQEIEEWLPFAEAILRCWLEGNQSADREIFICPELGPVTGGYALSTFPKSWNEVLILRREIDRLWRRVIS